MQILRNAVLSKVYKQSAKQSLRNISVMQSLQNISTIQSL